MSPFYTLFYKTTVYKIILCAVDFNQGINSGNVHNTEQNVINWCFVELTQYSHLPV